MNFSGNIFDIPYPMPDGELTEIILSNNNVRIERIVSHGQVSPDGFWYDQPENEWVLVLSGCGELEFECETIRLTAGESYLIKSHRRHRVSYTSIDPPCVWLCVFAVNSSK